MGSLVTLGYRGKERAMIFGDLFDKFVAAKPAAVMARGCFEYAFAADALDDLFGATAVTPSEGPLLFSTLVGLLGAVVPRRYPSVHAADRADPEAIAVSVASVYGKLNRTEPGIAEAVVRHTAGRLRQVCQEWPTREEPFAGWQLRIVDGNSLGGTDHRLEPLRGHGAAALPGMVIALPDHATGLVTDPITREDAYTNERAVLADLVDRLRAREVVIADRNFCVAKFLAGIGAREAGFIIRHHAGLKLIPVGDRRAVGTTDTGAVFEQDVRVGRATYRVVIVVLAEPTRNGDTELRLLTNLPADQATGVAVAEAYRSRWTIEATFLTLTRTVPGELSTLGYPRAALPAFALGVSAANAIPVVEQALMVAQGTDHPNEEVSGYYVVNELVATHDGLDVAVPGTVWATVRGWTATVFARWLIQVARNAHWERYRKTDRGPKKPVRKTIAGRRAPHRSTYRVLETRRNSANSPPRP